MASTQDFIPIEQIRQGVVMLKNKALRGVLMVSSINFALQSQDERKATIYSFQNFLNILDFSCQILVQSRRLNLSGYLDELERLEKQQERELLQIQTREYRKFIEELLAQGIIMSKKFFVIVPFTIWESQKNQEKKTYFFQKPEMPKMTEDNFQRCRSQLWQRMEFVAMGLRRCGLKSVPLKTSELIEFFWTLYHPEQAEVGHYPRIPPELIQ